MVTGINTRTSTSTGAGAASSLPPRLILSASVTTSHHNSAQQLRMASPPGSLDNPKRPNNAVSPALKHVQNNNRRSNKPIMEKRRRARINNCLNELKALILDATKKDPARHSKLEKADILEKTVKHLQELQKQRTMLSQPAVDPNSLLNEFKVGFMECATEVGRFTGIEPTAKQRLLQHLGNCLNGNTRLKTAPDDDDREADFDAQMDQNKMEQQGQQQTPTQSNNLAMTANGQYYLMTSQGAVGVQLMPAKTANNIGLFLPQGFGCQTTTSSVPMLIPIGAKDNNPSPNQSFTSSSSSLSISSSDGGGFNSRSHSPSEGTDELSMNFNARTEPAEEMDCESSVTGASAASITAPQQSVIVRRTTLRINPDPSGIDGGSDTEAADVMMPLSLVTRKSSSDDETVWRPW